MIKKILCLMLALVCVASMAVIGVSAADETKIYFEVPSDWNNYSAVYCHIWAYGGDSLAAWQSKKEKCTEVEAGLYSYDISKVGELAEGQYYGVIFSVDTGLQTYDTLMGAACYGDTLYSDGTIYENPADSSKTAVAAFWKGQDASAYGPVKQLTSIGNLVGTCCPPGVTDESIFTTFITGENLDNARTYSGKDDQAIIDDMAAALNLDNATVAALIADAGVEIAWEAAEEEVETTVAPETEAATTVAPETEAATTAPAEEETAGVKVTVDGVEYIAQVGDVITYTANLTTPNAIENIQAYTSYDAATLKLVSDASTMFPNMLGVVANPQDGIIYYNASEITKGFDFTAGQALITLEFEVIGEADAAIATTIEEMVEFFGGDYVTGGEIVADGVAVAETLVVPEVIETTTTAPETEAVTTAPVVEDTDATSATEKPADKPADVPATGATVAIYVAFAVIAMAAAAVVVLRKKVNG